MEWYGKILNKGKVWIKENFWMEKISREWCEKTSNKNVKKKLTRKGMGDFKNNSNDPLTCNVLRKF
jgi:hypothetical protein